MKRFFWRILICVVPTLLSLGIIAYAYNEYQNGRGGFILGVDLSGGTTLVYEVDESKMTTEARATFKVEDLAAALKRRIDPADLYNVTIRPIGGTPERVEIVLPTGGKHQADIERENWTKLLAAAEQEFPIVAKNEEKADKKSYDVSFSEGRPVLAERITLARQAEVKVWVEEQAKKEPWKDVLTKAAETYPEPKPNPELYAKIPEGKTDELVLRIMDVERQKIDTWMEKNASRTGSKGRKMLTGDEVENIKNLISRQGRLEFRILANPEDDRKVYDVYLKGGAIATPEEQARLEQRAEPPPAPRGEDLSTVFNVNITNEPDHSYSWVEIGKSYLWGLGLNSEGLAKNPAYKQLVESHEASGKPFVFPPSSPQGSLLYVRPINTWSRRNVKERQQGKTREFFILVRDPIKGQEITGDYLVTATQGRSDRGGQRAIDFVFNNEGGDRFYDVTSRNRPSGGEGSGFKRHLAIIFDGQITSAPSLNSPIRTHGQITGDFTQQEIDDSLRILRAGALPATLKREPVSENSTGSTLGAETVFWGTWSVGGAFVAVMLFMVFYYRFAGLVACVALLANLLLTVAFMVVVQAAFTLPGLAGLVLMLGMAVDANVLIYERLREERDRGASLMQALRNGYERAFPTILDTHLSSIFTAIVLYVVGNDQLKGFGISLTVGLIISLFTSLFMTRTIFEIWLFKGWAKELRFFNGLVNLIHSRYWDFMSIRQYWFTATIILTVLGAGLFLYRADSDPQSGKSTVLNIDFTGGTLYTGQLNEPMNRRDLLVALDAEHAPLPDLSITPNFVSTGAEEDKPADAEATRYFTLRTSEKDAEKVLTYISKQLEGKLKMLKVGSYAVETGKGGATGARLTFSDEKGNPEFASRAQVQRVVASEFVRVGLSPSSFSLEPPAKRTMEWDDVRINAAIVYPPVKDQNYSDVKKDDRGDLAKAIFTRSVKPRIETWVKDNAKTELKTLIAEAEKTFTEPVPGAFAKATDATKLQAEIEKGESDKVAEWAKTAVVGSVEKDGHYSAFVMRMSDPIPPAQLNNLLASVRDKFQNTPQPERLEVFDKQLASNTQERALYAILLSWGAILLYLWFRFGNWTFGAAAVMCLIHDLFFTLGVIALAHYIHALDFQTRAIVLFGGVGVIAVLAVVLGARGVILLTVITLGVLMAGVLQFVGDFKIDLQTVAALLTLVGYSVNDTIVVFDRIREVRGKSPQLTAQMINDSVNQTLTRTILASATVMVVVLVLYAMGGEGVKLFAFVMIVGVIVGTYSSIYIASPLLLIFGEGRQSAAEMARAAQAADRI